MFLNLDLFIDCWQYLFSGLWGVWSGFFECLGVWFSSLFGTR